MHVELTNGVRRWGTFGWVCQKGLNGKNGQ